MKKIIILVCVITAAIFMLTACKKTEPVQNGSSASSENAGSTAASVSSGSFDPSAVKTMGDILPYEETGNYQEAYSEKQFVYVFVADGVYYRAKAALTKEAADMVWGEEYDEERDQKVRELISKLEIDSIENLSEQVPTQEELDKLIGKTGQELFDDGWTDFGYDLSEMNANMYHGDFAYIVHFEYEGEQMVNTDDFDFYEAFKDLKVGSVKFDGLGNAANPE